jgi:hypothetical protein
MSAVLSLYDARPFFEKVLVYGVQNHIIGPEKLEAIRVDAPKGMVQIARYFGSEFLRPELERAKERIVNLVSLHLEDTSKGDLQIAAEMLRDHSFMSRSKAGADMLKAMIGMPQNSHFGLNEPGGFSNEHIPILAKWSLRSLADYQAEYAKRGQASQLIDAAVWFAGQLGLDASDLEDAGKDAEAVVRTGLLVLTAKRTDMPNWVEFETMMAGLRKKYALTPSSLVLKVPGALPARLRACVDQVRQSVEQDLFKIFDPSISVKKLFRQTPAFMERYFWQEDSLGEVEHYERSLSATWSKATGGHIDEGSLITLFLCLAVGAAPKTVLTEKSAATLVRKIRKNGLQHELALRFIQQHAPPAYQDDYAQMWVIFFEEARPTLLSDLDYALNDAMALLRREANVTQ